MKEVVVGIIHRESDGNQEYLLMSSKNDFGEFTGLYYPPGGHLEEGEKEEETLIREIKEEIGWDVKPVKKISETSGDVQNQSTHWWLCEADTNQPLSIQENEVQDVKWFTKEEIEKSNELWPATKNLFTQYLFK